MHCSEGSWTVNGTVDSICTLRLHPLTQILDTNTDAKGVVLTTRSAANKVGAQSLLV